MQFGCVEQERGRAARSQLGLYLKSSAGVSERRALNVILYFNFIEQVMEVLPTLDYKIHKVFHILTPQDAIIVSLKVVFLKVWPSSTCIRILQVTYQNLQISKLHPKPTESVSSEKEGGKETTKGLENHFNKIE